MLWQPVTSLQHEHCRAGMQELHTEQHRTFYQNNQYQIMYVYLLIGELVPGTVNWQTTQGTWGAQYHVVPNIQEKSTS